jgi:conjugal transfer pilus assembly protein TraK
MRRLLSRAAAIAALILVAASAFAQQVVDATEARAHAVTVSSTAPNRIAVDGGRIVNVIHDPVDLDLRAEPESGQIFVLPKSKRPISLFVITDLNQTHSLVLQPSETPSQTVIIREMRRSVGKDAESQRPVSRSVVEKAGSHDLSLKRLIGAMARGERPVEFSVAELNKSVTLWREVRFVLLAEYKGRTYLGEHYRLTNTTPNTLRLVEQELFKDGVVAVAIELQQLMPGQSTDVFVVRHVNG